MFELERPYRKPRPEKPVERRCHRCHGTGRCACRSCGGQGRTATSRSALGEPVYIRCTACYGSKVCRCITCAGIGFIT